jgi:hypothetical protein
MRLRRLPIQVRPAHHETIASYIARLANVHAVAYGELWQALSVPARPGGVRRQLVLQRLADLTGRPPDALQRALPEARDPAPDWWSLRQLDQYACPLCTAAHAGGPVRRLHAHHQFLCARHSYWIGHPDPVTTTRRRNLGALIPELTIAQRRHERLVHRHGWAGVFHAIEASVEACLNLACGPLNPGHPWPDRITRLHHRRELPRTDYLAALYPEIVALAHLFFDPTSARLAPASYQHRSILTTRVQHALRHPHAHAGTDDTVQAWTQSGIHEWLDHFTTAWLLRPHHTFPDTRRPTADGTAAQLAGHHAHDRLAVKARTEFRRHGRYPAWCLPRNLHYGDEPLGVHEITNGDHAEAG